MYYYIHGFASGVHSRSYLELKEHFGDTIRCLTYDSAASFPENMNSLCQQIDSTAQKQVLFIGTSLGGYYANVLASRIYLCPCILFNPVIDPVTSLRSLQGDHVNFSTGNSFTMTSEVVKSYATNDDLRTSNILRVMILGTKDNLIDANLTRAEWKNDAIILMKDEEHRIASMRNYVSLIEEFTPWFDV